MNLDVTMVCDHLMTRALGDGMSNLERLSWGGGGHSNGWLGNLMMRSVLGTYFAHIVHDCLNMNFPV
jgi:hypothetical protein